MADPADPRRADCLAALDLLRGSGEASTCAQILIEYWVGATRLTDVNGLGLDTVTASRNLRLVVRLFPCLPEPSGIGDLWHQVVAKHDVKGKQAHDARLVALMLAHGITHILTLNPKDFARYSEITALTPQDIL